MKESLKGFGEGIRGYTEDGVGGGAGGFLDIPEGTF